RPSIAPTLVAATPVVIMTPPRICFVLTPPDRAAGPNSSVPPASIASPGGRRRSSMHGLDLALTRSVRPSYVGSRRRVRRDRHLGRDHAPDRDRSRVRDFRRAGWLASRGREIGRIEVDAGDRL